MKASCCQIPLLLGAENSELPPTDSAGWEVGVTALAGSARQRARLNALLQQKLPGSHCQLLYLLLLSGLVLAGCGKNPADSDEAKSSASSRELDEAVQRLNEKSDRDDRHIIAPDIATDKNPNFQTDSLIRPFKPEVAATPNRQPAAFNPPAESPMLSLPQSAEALPQMKVKMLESRPERKLAVDKQRPARTKPSIVLAGLQALNPNVEERILRRFDAQVRETSQPDQLPVYQTARARAEPPVEEPAKEPFHPSKWSNNRESLSDGVSNNTEAHPRPEFLGDIVPLSRKRRVPIAASVPEVPLVFRLPFRESNVPVELVEKAEKPLVNRLSIPPMQQDFQEIYPKNPAERFGLGQFVFEGKDVLPKDLPPAVTTIRAVRPYLQELNPLTSKHNESVPRKALTAWAPLTVSKLRIRRTIISSELLGLFTPADLKLPRVPPFMPLHEPLPLPPVKTEL